MKIINKNRIIKPGDKVIKDSLENILLLKQLLEIDVDIYKDGEKYYIALKHLPGCVLINHINS